MRIKSNFVFVLSLTLAIGAAFIINSHEVVGASKQTVTAVKVKKAPASLNDPAWQKANAAGVHFEGKERFDGKNAMVTTKAV